MDTSMFSRESLKQSLLNKPEQQVAPLPQLFAILNDKAEQQILQVILSPASIAFVRATKIYSSGQIKTSKVTNQRFSLLSIVGKDVEVEQLVNDSPSLKLLGIKHPTKNGPILILDLAAYRQDLYFNYEALIASLNNPTERPKHPELSLRLAEYKKKADNIFDILNISQDVLVLQAQSAIVEKYLAAEEQFQLFERESVMALSKSVKAEKAKDRGLKLKGPGWVFFQTNSTEILSQKRGRFGIRIIVYFSIVIALLQILLAGLL